jgi:hypothetical protein
MLYLPITRSWLVSRTARRIYVACAVLSLALAATIIAVHSAMSAAGVTALTPTAAAVVRLLLLPEIAGAALLWVAMWYFWFSVDRGHFLKKASWFVALFFFAPLGPALYYFFVFRRYSQEPDARVITS